MRTKSGFTLVEILIVVVILGILAAIVIPQFTGASTEAKESSLMSDLQAIRSQIELYKIQHNDLLPGATPGVETTADTFVEALTSKTNQDGVVGTGATFRFGPYVQKLPANPFNDLSTVLVGTAKQATGDNTTGWYLVDSTGGVNAGLFQANDDKTNVITNVEHVDY